MANINSPFGLLPVYDSGSTRNYILAISQTIKRGDPLVLNAGGQVVAGDPTSTGFVGIAAEDKTTGGAATAAIAVWDGVDDVFVIQTGSHALLQADLGDKFDLDGSSGAWLLDLATTTVGQFKIVEFDNRDSIAAYARVRVKISRHQLGNDPLQANVALASGDLINNPSSGHVTIVDSGGTPSELTIGALIATDGTFTGAVGVTGDVGCNDLNAGGNVAATGNVSGIDGTFSGDVSGANGTLTGDLGVTGNISCTDLSPSGTFAPIDITATGNISGVDGTFTGDLAVTGNASANELTLADDCNCVNLQASGDVNATGNVSAVNGNLSGDLGCDNIIAGGDITATGNMACDDSTVNGNLAVTGSIGGASATIVGAIGAASASLSGDLDCDDVNAGGDVKATGNVSGVLGTFTGDLVAVKGTFSGDVAGIKGTFTGDVAGADGTFSGDLAVTGDISGDEGTFADDVNCVNLVASGAIGGAAAAIVGTCSANALTSVTQLLMAKIATPAGDFNIAAQASGYVRVNNAAAPRVISFDSAVAGCWILGIPAATNGGNSITLNVDSSGGDLSYAGGGDIVLAGATDIGKVVIVVGDGTKYFISAAL